MIVGVTVTGVVPTFDVVVPLLSVTTSPDGFEVTLKEVGDAERSAAPPEAVQVTTEPPVLVPELLPELLPVETAELPPPPPHAERPKLITSPAARRGAPTKFFTLQSLL